MFVRFLMVTAGTLLLALGAARAEQAPENGGSQNISLAPEKTPGPEAAQPVPMLHPDALARGMKGYGLTVFQGDKIERFDVEIISVVRNWYPKQDVILARCSHPLLEKSKVVAGMSGSPIYIMNDGTPHLIGALAYGWSFQVEPICGITPIGTMLGELRRDIARREIRGTEVARRSADAAPRSTFAGLRSFGDFCKQVGLSEGVDDDEVLRALLRHTRGPSGGRALPMGGQLQALPLPVTVGAGSGGRGTRLQRLLSETGILPVARGAVGGGEDRGDPVEPETPLDQPAPRLKPGGAIGVQLLRGDADWSGTGTVTYVDDRGVLAFGHPMFGGTGAGAIEAPVTTARVHTIIASQYSSFKLSQSGVPVGSLTRDSQSCIVARHGQAPSMVPIHVQVTGAVDGRQRTFYFEAMRHYAFTPSLVLYAVWDAVAGAEPVMDYTTLRVKQRLKFEGLPPLELSDVYASDGPFAFGIVNPMLTLSSWPYGEMMLEEVRYEVEVHRERRTASIESIRCDSTEVRAGDTLRLKTVLRAWNGQRHTIEVPVKVPTDTQPGSLTVRLCGGSYVAPDLPPPDTVEDLVQGLKQLYRSTDLVAVVHRSTFGLHHRGRAMPELPGSVRTALTASNDTGTPSMMPMTHQESQQTDWVLSGAQALSVTVVK